MTKAYSAKWIIPSDGNLYEDCTMIVDEGKIEKIIKTKDLEKENVKHIRDYGNSVITAGFINLHNHLQYTDIGKIHSSGFFSFLRKLLVNFKKHYFFAGLNKKSFTYRLADLLSEYFCWDRDKKLQSFEDGLKTSLLMGTTCVAQLSKETKYFEILNNLPIKTYLFFELFSDSPDSSKDEFRSIQKKIDKLLKQKSENTFVGVAPHSICSTHKRLFKTLVKYCKKNNLLMTTRICESKEEMDWIKHGFSDIDLLNVFTEIKKFTPYIKGVSPVEYLDNLGVINKHLIASYCNYLKEEDLETLSKNGVYVAYCPRISDKLHNKKLDFDTLLKYFPDRFGFGTNSLAFNDDMSLLNELRSVNQGQLGTLKAIEYLTKIPAKILRLNNIIGTLEAGKDADFNIFKLNDGEDYNALLNKEKPDFVYIKGSRVVENGSIRKKLVQNL